MAIGDKKMVGLVEDWGQPNSPATLDENGILTPAQWPALDDLGAADRVLSNLTDPAQAIYNLGAKPGENLLRNWYFADPVDQRGGYVVPPDTPYYSDTGLTTQVGATASYATATNVDGVYGEITVSSTTYYVDWTAAVRGYVGSKMTINGWRNESGIPANVVVLILDDGIKFINLGSGNTIFRQNTDMLIRAGEPYTFSVLVSEYEGTPRIYIGNTAIKTGVTSGTWTATSDRAPSVYFWLQGAGSVTVKAAKLELGDHQTLARQGADGNWVLLGPPPDKGLELLRCITSTADPSDTYANKVILDSGNVGEYALPLTGGTLTGALTINHNGVDAIKMTRLAENVNISMHLYPTGTNTGDGKQSGYIGLIDGEGNKSQLRFSSAAFVYASNDNENTILHTGNKPSGSYTGNGDATSRTIETGGIGSVVAIVKSGFLSLAFPYGAIYAQDGTTQVAGSSLVKFQSGTLTIADDSVFNASGATYYYQVL